MSSWTRRATNALIAAIGIAAVAYIIQLSMPVGTTVTSTQRTTRGSEGPQTTVPLIPGGTKDVPDVIRIGWTAWTDAEVITRLARRILEDRFGIEVELVMADIGIQYQGVAHGDLDLMLMAWLPVTHRDYWRRFADDVVNLGIIYTRARLGWAVPEYIPESELRSITDLTDPTVRRRLNARIQGIDPGSGLMQVSETALAQYGLESYELISSSGAAMTAALARAIDRQEWIVVTAWSPHWLFARWPMRYLDDPRRVFGGRERVHILARDGFYQDFPPEVSEFLARMYLPLDELEAALLTATGDSVEAAVEEYMQLHAERIEYWVTGNLSRE
jgi:glycine betaine/proline transport system substrate-binding protein